MSKPTVHVSHDRRPITDGQLCGQVSISPGIQIEVTFQLHDHKEALWLLDLAVADIRAQIEETT